MRSAGVVVGKLSLSVTRFLYYRSLVWEKAMVARPILFRKNKGGFMSTKYSGDNTTLLHGGRKPDSDY